MDVFGCPSGNCFLSELDIGALCANIFEKFGKDEMKNQNLHSNLSNPKNLPKE
jgi:hypothetical protein